MNRKLAGTIQLTLTALIWGVAFVAQKAGMDYVGPWTFNCTRFVIGGTVLIPVVLLFRPKRTAEELAAGTGRTPGNTAGAGGKSNPDCTAGRSEEPAERNSGRMKMTIVGGILSGLCLASASLFQQYGIIETSVGKAGFITALYIILVPFLSIFLKKKTGLFQWLSAVIAVVGFYVMSIRGYESINRGDLLLLVCALLFSVQILVIDRFVEHANPIAMSCVQFFTSAVICLGGMIAERPSMQSLLDAKVPILYAGVMSCGIAYTLQLVGQKNLPPTPASLLMSLESVWSAIAGFVILHQTLSKQEILGCVLVFTGVILAQLPTRSKNGTAGNEKELSDGTECDMI